MPPHTHAPRSDGGSRKSPDSPSRMSRASEGTDSASQAFNPSTDEMSRVPYQVAKTARGQRIKPRRAAQSAVSTQNPTSGKVIRELPSKDVKSAYSIVASLRGMMSNAISALTLPDEDWLYPDKPESVDWCEFTSDRRKGNTGKGARKATVDENEKEEDGEEAAEASIWNEKMG